MDGPGTRLRQLYADMDDRIGAYLAQQPEAACDAGCADCCQREPPLVSREEAQVLLEALSLLPEELQQQVRSAARTLVFTALVKGRSDFTCPLLVQQDGTWRCCVYPGRPYACRSFGHTSRAVGEAAPQPFTCPRIQPRLRKTPPPVAFRSLALREAVGVETLVDSYLPVWVGLDPSELEERPSGRNSAVVVPRRA